MKTFLKMGQKMCFWGNDDWSICEKWMSINQVHWEWFSVKCVLWFVYWKIYQSILYFCYTVFYSFLGFLSFYSCYPSVLSYLLLFFIRTLNMLVVVLSDTLSDLLYMNLILIFSLSLQTCCCLTVCFCFLTCFVIIFLKAWLVVLTNRNWWMTFNVYV